MSGPRQPVATRGLTGQIPYTRCKLCNKIMRFYRTKYRILPIVQTRRRKLNSIEYRSAGTLLRGRLTGLNIAITVCKPSAGRGIVTVVDTRHT